MCLQLKNDRQILLNVFNYTLKLKVPRNIYKLDCETNCGNYRHFKHFNMHRRCVSAVICTVHYLAAVLMHGLSVMCNHCIGYHLSYLAVAIMRLQRHYSVKVNLTS
jgi:hypothetical protein